MSKINNNDQQFMGYALRIARQNIGITASNPSVGAVIVKNDQIIATGVTARTGRPHAEAVAINKISDKNLLIGATIYVTLEPCCHHGLSGPCVDLIIAAKFSKVVIATKDPDQRVNGQSIKKLQDAGIEVIYGVNEAQALELNRAFFKVKLTGKPYVTLKLATSLDGKIATKNHHSKWITGTAARNFSHYLRSTNDCIMVGANTIKKDNPDLGCRLAGLTDNSPIKAVISTKLDFNPNCAILNYTNSRSTLILTSPNPNQNNLKKLQKFVDQKNIEIIFCKNNQEQTLDLSDALYNLAQRNINSILVEGGQNLATNLLKQNLIDELIWIRNKRIIGGDGISAIGDLNLLDANHAINNFNHFETINYDEDTIEIYRSYI